MTWYLVPIVEVPAEEGRIPSIAGYSPASGGLPFGLPPESRAQIPLKGAPPTSGLVGCTTPLEVIPEDWVLQTLEEAQAEFEMLFGRPPTADEVF